MDIALTTERLRRRLTKDMGEKRLTHSLAVAKLCESLAQRANIEPKLAYFTGLAHDIGRIAKRSEQEALMLECEAMLGTQGLGGLGPTISKNKSLYHGPAGEMMLRKEFPSLAPAAYLAVRYHSLGCEYPEPLCLAVFLADKIEMGREDIPIDLRRRALTDPSLTDLALEYLGLCLDRGKRGLWQVAPETLSMYNSLVSRR